MKKTSLKYCAKCYWCDTPSSTALSCGRYTRLGIGYRRGCPPGYCDKFLKRNHTKEEYEENIKKGKSE